LFQKFVRKKEQLATAKETIYSNKQYGNRFDDYAWRRLDAFEKRKKQLSAILAQYKMKIRRVYRRSKVVADNNPTKSTKLLN